MSFTSGRLGCALLSIVAICLFFFHGMNFGIDFIGGTLIEVQSRSGPADLAKMRIQTDTIRALEEATDNGSRDAE